MRFFRVEPIFMFLKKKPIITVGEARKLLGKDSESLNDNQVNEIITILSLLARQYIRNSGSKT
jgi:hypothetical protein